MSDLTDMSSRPPKERPSIIESLSVPHEVHLRRMKVEPALVKLEGYLYDAKGAGHPRVRVIHGKGTGIMKAAVREHLTTHPLISGYYDASPAEGNGGVTIAVLI